jgi:hypothetical protein
MNRARFCVNCDGKLSTGWNARIAFSQIKGNGLEQASHGLEKIVTQSLRQMPANEAPLIAWPLVCGSVVAERTRALGFEAGVLRIEVADAGWKAELQSLAPKYLAGINQYTNETVYKLDFVVAGASNCRT